MYVFLFLIIFKRTAFGPAIGELQTPTESGNTVDLESIDKVLIVET